jgi:hypothetical protein
MTAVSLSYYHGAPLRELVNGLSEFRGHVLRSNGAMTIGAFH